MRQQYQGILTEKEEFLYPYSPLAELPETLHIAMAANGKPGIQLLLQTKSQHVQMRLEGEGFLAEWYEMRAIPVEYNTGDGENQGGATASYGSSGRKTRICDKKSAFFCL